MAKKELDLHGYRTENVEAAIDQFLFKLHNTGLKKASIMTGKGTGAVKSIAIKYLKLAGYHWEYETLPNGKKNEGRLIIFLD
jgi:DNA-nicking Smr family endonuclease